MAQEDEATDESEAEDGEDENQYGGGEGDIDAVEQTERMTDDDEQSTEENEEE